MTDAKSLFRFCNACKRSRGRRGLSFEPFFNTDEEPHLHKVEIHIRCRVCGDTLGRAYVALERFSSYDENGEEIFP